MTIPLSDELRRLIDERLKTGGYNSPEDVLPAGLAALEQNEKFGDFASGELDALLEEGERSILEGHLRQAEDVRSDLQRRSDRQDGRGKE